MSIIKSPHNFLELPFSHDESALGAYHIPCLGVFDEDRIGMVLTSCFSWRLYGRVFLIVCCTWSYHLRFRKKYCSKNVFTLILSSKNIENGENCAYFRHVLRWKRYFQNFTNLPKLSVIFKIFDIFWARNKREKRFWA